MPTRIALVDERGALTYAELGALAATVSRNGDAPVISPLTTREGVARVLGRFDRGAPFALAHPRWTAAERDAATLRCAGVEGTGDVLVFTSGSGGRPKIVRLSRRALEAAAIAHAEALPWQDDDRWLVALPIAHVGGLSILTRALHARRTVVLLAAFDPEVLLSTIEARRVTLLSLVPTMLERVAAQTSPPSLRAVLLGGAAARPALVEQARGNGWPVLPSWGMSETCAQVCTQRLGAERERGVGTPLPGMQVRIVGGEIEVAGPALMSGYLDESTPIVDGWFPTGDLGRIDDDGHLHILGRADDRIVTGGENVDPSEVEAALLEHPDITRVCVFGMPDDTWGDVVCAAIVAEEPLDIESHLGPRLARFKHPRRVFMRSALPTLASGKVDRAALRGAAGAPDRVLEPPAQRKNHS